MSDDRSPRSGELLPRYLQTGGSFSETLERVAALAAASVPAAAMAGITMTGESGAPATTIFTDPLARTIDDSQYRSRRGPCLEAWRTGRTVAIEMTEADGRFPEFAAECLQHGVLSTLSLPMVTGERCTGALNLYAHVEDGFSSEDAGVGASLAHAASAVLANARAHQEVVELIERLGKPPDLRDGSRSSGPGLAGADREQLDRAPGAASTGASDEDFAAKLRVAMDLLRWELRDLVIQSFSYGVAGTEADVAQHLRTGNHLASARSAVVEATLNDALIRAGSPFRV